jgi:hypothetical protein
MAGFTGSFVTQKTDKSFVTHLVRAHTETALCGAPVNVKGFSLRITSSEVGPFLRTLLKAEANPCPGCLEETGLLD